MKNKAVTYGLWAMLITALLYSCHEGLEKQNKIDCRAGEYQYCDV